MTETMVQFSIYLGKKPARLGQVCRELAQAKINIVALTMMDSSEHSVLRLVPKDPDRARDAFKRLNLPTDETKVLAVTLPNRPGAAADACERLSAARVQIAYMYSTTGAPGGKAIAIMKVSNNDKASKVLETRRAMRRDMKQNLRNFQRASAGRR